MVHLTYTGPSIDRPGQHREKARQHRRDRNIKMQVPDARAANPVNAHSPRSIMIGSKTDEGKLLRLAKALDEGGWGLTPPG